jgi:hypothetical protein
MNCPEYGTCRDPEWCQQGGSCSAAINSEEFVELWLGTEPWPLRLLASVTVSGLSLAIGAYGALTTWSLAPLRVTVVGFGVSFLLAVSAIPWRGAWQEMRERQRVEAAFEAIVAEEAQR